MASARIDKYLVPQLDEIDKIPSVAEIELVFKLTKLEKKYYAEEARKNDLEKKFKFLEELITYSRTRPIKRDAENNENESDEQLFCPICGHMSSSKIIIKVKYFLEKLIHILSTSTNATEKPNQRRRTLPRRRQSSKDQNDFFAISSMRKPGRFARDLKSCALSTIM